MSQASPPLLHLSASTLETMGLPVEAIADAVARGVRAVHHGRASSLPKSSIVPGDGRLFQMMLAASDDPSYAMVKAVGLSAGNSHLGLPHIGATVTLMDGSTGLPLALIDGAWLTAVRTAAISALAGRYLAPAAARSMAFVGCGEQARRHLCAFAAEHPITRVTALSRALAGAEAFAGWARDRCNVDAVATTDPRSCLGGADIVVTSVPASVELTPFLDPGAVQAGAFVAACDLGRAFRDGLEGFDVVTIDDRAQDAGSGAPMLPAAAVHAELVELVTGTHPGRTAPDQRTAFVFRGLAIADLAAAWAVYEHALDRGLGQRLQS